MKSYTEQELDDALTAIESTIKKIEKVGSKDTLGQSQRTLIERRLKSLTIAVELIEEKLKCQRSGIDDR